jgi:hypothetical protein
MPFVTGSTTVSATAVAIAASDRVAALGQHGEPRLGGEWLTGGDAIGGENRLADRRVGNSPVHA